MRYAPCENIQKKLQSSTTEMITSESITLFKTGAKEAIELYDTALPYR